MLKSFISSFIVILFAYTHAATHDEIAQCGLQGVYKTRQSVIESPNYPNHYPSNTCWDYVIRSPYKCPTKFHIQFLDFYLENSENCTNDYLAIGLQSDSDDMDVLCGQVIGIRKYYTPDGVLRLRFFTDDSPWTRGKGFKLIITRLACENNQLLRANLDSDDDNDEDTVLVNAPPKRLQLPENGSKAPFQNTTWQQQQLLQQQQQQLQHLPFVTPPYYGGFQIAGQLPNAPPAGYGGYYLPQSPLPFGAQFNTQTLQPCKNDNQQETQQQQQQQQQPVQQTSFPQFSQLLTPGYQPQLAGFQDQYRSSPFPLPPLLKATEFPVGVATTTEGCCLSPFRQNHFYLSSPGFPRTVFTALLPTQKRDCIFQFEKSTGSVCRMRIEFKFFDFGQTYGGVGLSPENFNVGIGTSHDVCREDFIEIDGERFCGCRSGYTYNSVWGTGKKLLHMRMGYSGLSSNGFLLEIFQEECSATEQQQQQQLAQRLGPFAGMNGNSGLTNNLSPLQNANPSVGGVNRIVNFGSQAGLGNQQLSGLGNQQLSGLGNQQLSGLGNQQFTGFGNQQFNGLSNQQLSGLGNYNTQNYYQLQQQQALLAQQQQGMFGQQPAFLGQQQPQQPFYQQSLIQNQPYLINQRLLLPTAYPSSSQQQYPFTNQFPQFRNARSLELATALNDQQPLTVVETNSTRKEYYFYDGDQAFARSSISHDPDDQVEHTGLHDHANTHQQLITKAFTTERNKCTYDAADVLRLSLDTQWIMKPLCITPPSSWFSNLVG